MNFINNNKHANSAFFQSWKRHFDAKVSENSNERTIDPFRPLYWFGSECGTHSAPLPVLFNRLILLYWQSGDGWMSDSFDVIDTQLVKGFSSKLFTVVAHSIQIKFQSTELNRNSSENCFFFNEIKLNIQLEMNASQSHWKCDQTIANSEHPNRILRLINSTIIRWPKNWTFFTWNTLEN